MMFFKTVAVMGIVFLSGCAGVVQKEVEQQQPDLVRQEGHEEKKSLDVARKTAIDGDVLYLLLMAELAGQRQMYNVALEGYLRAARRVDDAAVAERAAKIAFFVKDIEKADEAANLWLKQTPDSIPARRIATMTAFRRNDKDKALEHLNGLLLADPAGFEKALLDLVGLLRQEVDPEVTSALLFELTRQHPDKAVLYFSQALLAMQMEKLDLAEQMVLKALELQPEWDKALTFQAQLAFFARQDEKAGKLLLAMIEREPDNKKIKNMLAQIYIRGANYEQAVDVYQGLIDDDSADKEAMFSLALVQMQLQQDKQARKLLMALLEWPEWDQQASYYLGRLAVHADDAGQALVWFDKVDQGMFAFDAAMGAVAVLMDLERWDEVASRLANIKLRFPEKHLQVLVSQADLLSQQKKYQQAFDLLTEALADKPEDKDLLYARALVADNLGRLDLLERDLLFILQRFPDDANTLNALGYTLADKTDRYQEAQQYLEKAISLKPDEPVIIDSYGWLQFKMGNVEQALTLLRKAYAGLQEYEIAAHLIEVLWTLDEKTEATELFNELIDKAPKDEYLIEIKQRIFSDQ